VNYRKELNIYQEPVQDAGGGSNASLLVVIILSVMVMCAMSGHWVRNKVREQQNLKLLQRRHRVRTIEAAKVAADTLSCPMALITAKDFLQLGRLTSFEILRDSKKLLFLDSVWDVRALKADCTIIFLSHQWLCWGMPDPNNDHYTAMCAAVVNMVGLLGGDPDTIFVWVDFISVPQRNRPIQELAVSSLPLYASLSDVFIIVAPPTRHLDTQKLCDGKTYAARGWCRAEMLSKVITTGTHRMFLCESAHGELNPVTPDMLEHLPMYVFEGSFSCCAMKHAGGITCDRERLICPILGIYSTYLATKSDEVDVTLARMLQDKERMFPRTHQVEIATELGESVEEHELFGPLPHMMEEQASKQVHARRVTCSRIVDV